jgi:hypothetical protein
MRPFTPIKTAPIAACACAALSLSLLAPVAALASEAANPFGGVAQSPAHAAKPVTGTGVGGAGKTAAKPSVAQTAASKKALQEAVQRALKSKTAGTAAKTSTETTGGAQESKTSTPMIMALVAGVLVLGGIAFVIVRDARSVAPVVEGVTGGTRNPEGRLRKRRAQAKAARRQRKRHRRR